MKRALIVLVVLLAAPVALVADNSKISPDLLTLPPGVQVQVIVQYTPGTQLNCSGILGFLVCAVDDIVQLGGAIVNEIPIVNGLVAVLDLNGILQLSN